jgi:hypothetical protein
VETQFIMRTPVALALIVLGGAIVRSTTDESPGFSALRALGLALMGLAGFLLLPRYMGSAHPGAPGGVRRPALRPLAHPGTGLAYAPVAGPALTRPGRSLVPSPTLPAPGHPLGYESPAI